MRWMVLMMLVGCGDAGEADLRTPEDYLPEGATLDGLTEAQRLCVLHRQVGYARMRECDPTGPEDWSALPTDDEVWAASQQTCRRPDQTMAVYTAPAPGEHIARCLDFRASAPCEALASPETDPTYQGCELVFPSW